MPSPIRNSGGFYDWNAFAWNGYCNALAIIDTIWYTSIETQSRIVFFNDVAMREYNLGLIKKIADSACGWL